MQQPDTASELGVKWVRKRDGAIVPFDTGKIAAAIGKAFRATGADDRFVADELAGMVALFVEKQYAGQIPGIEDIQDLVEKVLIETGHAAVAKAYILYREKRAQVRRRLAVSRSVPAPDGQAVLRVQPGSKDASLPWDKQRIARSLEVEADLDPDLARKIASAVEHKVLSSGLQRVSTNLIRELVASELVERELEGPLRRYALLGMPKYDFRQLLDQRDRLSPTAIFQRIAAHGVRQFALQEVFSPDVADAHLTGAIHLYHLEGVWQWAEVALDVAELATGASDLRELTERLDRAVSETAPWVAGSLSLGWLDAAYGDLAGQKGGDLAREGRSVGRLLTRVQAATSARLVAQVHAGASSSLATAMGAWLEGFGEEIAGRGLRVDCHVGPPLFTDPGRSAVLDWCLRLAGLGNRIGLVMDRGGPVALSPVMRVSKRPTEATGVACGCVAGVPQYVGLNLPAVLAERWRVPDAGSLYRRLEAALEPVWKALIQKREFLVRGLRPEGPTFGATGCMAYGLSLVGLEEAVHRLVGSPVADDPGAENLAMQIVEFLARTAGNQGSKLGLEVRLAAPLESEAGRRLGLSDEPAGGRSGQVPYSEGVEVSPRAGVSATKHLLLIGRLHERAGGGTLHWRCVDEAQTRRVCRLACCETAIGRVELISA